MNKKPLLVYVSPKTSQIKEFRLSVPKILAFILLFVLFCGFLLKFSVDFIVDFSQNSRISQLKMENEILQTELGQIADKMTTLRTNIDFLEEKDDKIRALLDLPPIDEDMRQVGIGGGHADNVEQYDYASLSFGEELQGNLELLERLEREVRLEKESYQQLVTTVERHQDSIRYLPALKPVFNAYISSSFGQRRHPILKKKHYHKGIDLATSRGTPIIAPADGVVVSAGRNGGYGLMITIDHKYGFETRYGHLDKIYVRKGQRIKRGDKIGEVGSTGLSTSSHLHYEILYNDKPVNPRNYFHNDIQF